MKYDYDYSLDQVVSQYGYWDDITVSPEGDTVTFLKCGYNDRKAPRDLGDKTWPTGQVLSAFPKSNFRMGEATFTFLQAVKRGLVGDTQVARLYSAHPSLMTANLGEAVKYAARCGVEIADDFRSSENDSPSYLVIKVTYDQGGHVLQDQLSGRDDLASNLANIDGLIDPARLVKRTAVLNSYDGDGDGFRRQR